MTVFRTGAGSVWYTVSDNDGATWRKPEPLRYRDGGERVLHPQSPCPLFALKDGRFLLQFHNNDGSASIGPSPLWSRAYFFSRRSLFLAVGQFRAKAHQPVWAGQAIAEKGHRRVALMLGAQAEGVRDKYVRGMRKALKKPGGELPDEFIFSGKDSSFDYSKQETELSEALEAMLGHIRLIQCGPLYLQSHSRHH